MAVATFDTLKFANTLKASGVPPQQAEAQAVAFAEVIQVNFKELVTKDDLASSVKDLKHEMKEIEQRLNAKIDTIDAKHRGEMALLKWMFGAMLGTNLAVVGLLLRIMYVRLP